MRKVLLSLLLLSLLSTCDRGSETLFQLRADTGVSSANMLQEREDFNIIEYLYYYNGGGVAAMDINGDGLPDLYFTNNQGPNKYYINEGGFRFRDATEVAAVAGAPLPDVTAAPFSKPYSSFSRSRCKYKSATSNLPAANCSANSFMSFTHTSAIGSLLFVQ